MTEAQTSATPQVVMLAYRPSFDDWTWHEQLTWFWTHEVDMMLELMESIIRYDIMDPILVNNKGLIIDGHKRVGIALALNLDVPINFIYET